MAARVVDIFRLAASSVVTSPSRNEEFWPIAGTATIAIPIRFLKTEVFMVIVSLKKANSRLLWKSERSLII